MDRLTGGEGGGLEYEAAREWVRGRRILVTGAGGSIGSALALALAGLGAGELILLDVAEIGLYELGCEPGLSARGVAARLVVGDIGEEALVREVFERHRPEIVFHAAACKHVPLMEANPFRAAATNALGTERMVRAAIEWGAEQCVLLSTDKAVEPSSVMGATKRIAELIVLAGPGSTRGKALRLGNVYGSSGSVAPLFAGQIARGGPVTVTDRGATRYFLPLGEAVGWLLATLAPEVPAGVLVAEMREPSRILDLAEGLIGRSAGAGGVEIHFTGLRPGDKLTERMISTEEEMSAAGVNGLRGVTGPRVSDEALEACLRDLREAVDRRDLPLLLRAIAGVVPGYRPSESLAREWVAADRVTS